MHHITPTNVLLAAILAVLIVNTYLVVGHLDDIDLQTWSIDKNISNLRR